MPTEYVSKMKNKDVTEGDVIFFYIETDANNNEVFAVPGGRIIGRANAIHAARCLIRSNPRMKGRFSNIVDKTVSRLSHASREGVDIVLGA